MKIKPNYLAIPLIVVAVAAAGNLFTFQGLGWYGTLRLPAFAPGGSFIGLVWTIIYILAVISGILFWNAPRRDNFRIITVLFLANALLNALWSYIFFSLHLIDLAVWEMLLLNASTVLLILLLRKYERRSAWLLLPYFIWVSFATYLAYLIAIAN